MTPTPPRRACQVLGCDEVQHGHGLCHTHLEAWRRRREASPELPADDLRPDRAREVEREAWVRRWLATGKGGILYGEICPWPCTWHLRVSIPQIDRFTDVEAIAEDWQRHRESLLAEAQPAWAAQYFE